ERDDVDRADPRMRALMRPQVDLAQRDADEGVGSGFDRIGRTREREDGSVVIDVARAIEESGTVDGTDRVGHAVDGVAATTFTDVGDTFDEAWHVAAGPLVDVGLARLGLTQPLGEDREDLERDLRVALEQTAEVPARQAEARRGLDRANGGGPR